MAYPMGEARVEPLRVDFDRRIKLEFPCARITSDGGLLAYRELDGALGLTDVAITQLLDGRRGKKGRHTLVGLFRQSVFGRLAGYEDVNDAERLAHDPAMRAIVGREGLERFCRVQQSDGPLRDRVAGERRQPGGAHGPVRNLDRPGACTEGARRQHPRHGQLRELPNCAQKARRKPQTAAVGSLTGRPGPSQACLLQRPDA